MDLHLTPALRATLVQRIRTYLIYELLRDQNISPQHYGVEHRYAPHMDNQVAGRTFKKVILAARTMCNFVGLQNPTFAVTLTAPYTQQHSTQQLQERVRFTQAKAVQFLNCHNAANIRYIVMCLLTTRYQGIDPDGGHAAIILFDSKTRRRYVFDQHGFHGGNALPVSALLCGMPVHNMPIAYQNATAQRCMSAATRAATLQQRLEEWNRVPANRVIRRGMCAPLSLVMLLV